MECYLAGRAFAVVCLRDFLLCRVQTMYFPSVAKGGNTAFVPLKELCEYLFSLTAVCVYRIK